MLKEGIRGSDLPSIEPRHIAGYNFPLVRFLKMGREIRGYWDLQHLIHIWGRVLKNLVKEDVQQVIHVLCNTKKKSKTFTLLHIFVFIIWFLLLFCNYIILFIMKTI